MINHAVISGGGHTVFCTMGAIQQLEEDGIWNIDNIKSMYGTSAGGLLSVALCLKFDWQTLNDYFIKRPWKDAFPIGARQILDAYTKRGIFDKSFIEIIYKPLFNAKDISMNITMGEFYEYSKVEIHLFTVELNSFETVDISYKTHPNLELLTALYMSSAVPIIFAPCLFENKCYMDGGITTNYPLDICMKNNKCDKKEEFCDTIISFANEYEEDESGKDATSRNSSVDESSSLLDYIMCFISKLIYNVSTEDIQPKIKNEIKYKIPHISLTVLKETIYNKEARQDLWDRGKKSAILYAETRNIKKQIGETAIKQSQSLEIVQENSESALNQNQSSDRP